MPGLAKGVSLYRMKKGFDDPNRIDERLGFPSLNRPNGPLIWFHAASIGETLLALTLIAQISKEKRNLNILLTTNTIASGEMVKSHEINNLLHQYLPYDFIPNIKRFLNHWNPSLVLFLESEFWPGFITEINKQNIPLLLLNGKMTDKSFTRWKRHSNLAKDLFNKFNLMLVQNQKIKSKFAELEVDKNKLIVTGQIKQDSKPLRYNFDELNKLEKCFKNRQIWLAASTHEGEEEIIAEAQKHLIKNSDKDILLIVAPRHPERGYEIYKCFHALGLKSVLRSKGELPVSKKSVFIADTIGEMGLWYRLASACFMGGSLVPVGGHNPYEPVILGCPVIHGIHFENFSEAYAKLAECGATQIVKTSEELSRSIEKALDPFYHSIYVHKARILEQGEGTALNKTLNTIRSFIPKVD